MFSDDVVYALLLLGSIWFGKLTRSPSLMANPEQRKIISTIGGLAVALTVSGSHIWHPIFGIVLQIGLLKVVPAAHVHWVSFGAGFGHLFFFRLCGYGSGWPWSFFTAPPAHTNAIQMILTIKMIGLAFEVHDTHVRRSSKVPDPSGKRPDLEEEFRSVDPTVADIFHYGLNHAGLLTGNYVIMT